MLGACRVAGREFPGMTVRSIDVTPTETGAPMNRLAELILAEVAGGDDAEAVAFRAGERWVQSSAPADPGMVCPVEGPTGYGDTWGAPRSGGRRHEGVDMISPKGTTLVAVADGEARFSQNALGGNSVSLSADDGTRYYYAHLSAYEGSSRRVSAGDVIGYVGSTGWSTGCHLHFTVLKDGVAVDPMGYL